MVTNDTVRPTRTERQTAELSERFRAHISNWWSRENEEFPDQDFDFYIADGTCQIWSCQLSKQKAASARGEGPTAGAAVGQEFNNSRTGPIIWFLWDGSEVMSYKDDEQEDAFMDMINTQKARRLTRGSNIILPR